MAEGSSQDSVTFSKTFTPRFGPKVLYSCPMTEFLRCPELLCPELPCLHGPPLKTADLGCLSRRLGYGWQCKKWPVSARPPRTMGPHAGTLTRSVGAKKGLGARRPDRQDITQQAWHTHPNPIRGSGPRTCWRELN